MLTPKKTVTGKDLAAEIAAETGYAEGKVYDIIKMATDSIKKHMMNNNKVRIFGFASFGLKNVKARKYSGFGSTPGSRSVEVGDRLLPKAEFSVSFAKKVKKDATP